MRDRRVPQQYVTSGMIAGNPSALATGGLVPSRNRFRVLPADKSGKAGAIDYSMKFESTTDALSAEILDGEYVDDLAVLGGTTTR